MAVTATQSAGLDCDGPVHEQVTEIQRARVLSAMMRVACEQGAANVTVARVVANAGVSRRTFYEVFTNCDDCLLAAFEQALARASAHVLPAYEAAGAEWRGRIRGALAALLTFFDEQPHIARLLVVEWPAAGARGLELRQRTMDALAVVVEEARVETNNRLAPSQVMAEGVVGAIAALLHARLLARERAPLIELLNPMMSIAVLPYLGPAAARGELEQPPPEIVVDGNGGGALNGKTALEGSLGELPMRLTYRTMLVLRSIAAAPGASNRAIGQAAGIDDQGQISKLLARLHRIGVVENRADGSQRGSSNAWALTAHGERFERSLRP